VEVCDMQLRRIGLLRIANALSALAVVFVANGIVDPVSAVAARVTAATTKPATTKPATTKPVTQMLSPSKWWTLVFRGLWP
jgi:hypothetical protein